MSLAPWIPIAQVASSMAAVIGLFLSCYQIRRATLAADLQALQKFFETANEHETALAKATDDNHPSPALVNFLNFLEINASAYNKSMFGRGSKELVRHKLEDSYIELEQSPVWHQQIEKAVDRATTFSEFSEFVRKNRREIDRRTKERGRLTRSESFASLI